MMEELKKKRKKELEFTPTSVDITKPKSVCPPQTLYGFKYLIKQEQTGLTAIPRDPLQVYSFIARGSHSEQLQLQGETIRRVVARLFMTIDL